MYFLCHQMFAKIDIDDKLSHLYKIIFPEVTDMNGIFGQKAIWYGLTNNNKTLIAFCTIGMPDDKTVFLYNVGVDPAYRHQGYGQQLMKHLLHLYGKYDICLFVDKNNAHAIKLYQKNHFIPIDHVYVPPEGHICMRRIHRRHVK